MAKYYFSEARNFWLSGFRRRLKCEKLTDNGHQVMEKTHITFGRVS
jgi:hypothetical protein